MDRYIATIEGSAIYRFLRDANIALWEIWQGSWLGSVLEQLAAWIRRSFVVSLFVERGDGGPSAIGAWLRTRLGVEQALAPSTQLERFGLYFLVVFVPIELFLETHLPHTITYLGDLTVVLLAISTFIRLNRASWPLRLTQADLPALLLFGAAVLSALWNSVPLTIAFFGTRAYLEYYALYLVLVYLPFSGGQRRELIIWFLVLAVAIALLGDAQKFLHVATPRQWLSAAEAATTRAYGTMGNPNTFGGFLVWSLAIFLSLLFGKVRGGLRTLSLIGVVVSVPALVFTLSREALIAFAVAALIIAVLADRRFLLLLLLGAALLPIADPHLIQRFTYALSSSYVSTSTSYGRLLFWSRGLQAFAAQPILGWGPGRFGGSVAHLYGSPVYALYGLGFKPIIDSQHVQTLVELGIVGYIAFIWLGVAAVRAGLRLFREDADPFWRAMGLALGAGTVGLYIQSFFASLLETHPVIIVFWLMFGMVAWRIKANREAPLATEKSA